MIKCRVCCVLLLHSPKQEISPEEPRIALEMKARSSGCGREFYHDRGSLAALAAYVS
jgi:hypothetical protein